MRNRPLIIIGLAAAACTVNEVPPASQDAGVDATPQLDAQPDALDAEMDAADSSPVDASDAAAGAHVCSGMIHWWRGEGDAKDSVGLDDGTLNNGVTFVPGRVGQAFHFNGTNQSVSLPGSYVAGTEVTVEAWIYLEKWSDWTSIVSPSNNGGFVTFDVFPPGPSDGAGGGGIAVFTNVGVISVASVSPSPLSVWRHVALTAKSGDLYSYEDGVAVAHTVMPYASLSPSSVVTIGAGCNLGNSGCQGRWFPGAIDEMTFYNRALSAAEVQSIYLAGAAGKSCP